LGQVHDRERIQELKQVSPIGTMMGGRRVDEIRITDESDFGQVVATIYTVRCLLMKGGKPATSHDREIQVCNAAAGALDVIAAP